MKKKIIIIGTGGHAKSCADVIQSLSKDYLIAGYVEKESVKEKKKNIKILGTDKDIQKLSKIYKYACIGLGQIISPKLRIRFFDNLKKLNFFLPTIISKNAYVSKNCKIGQGTIVMHGVIINAESNIGENCIINTKSVIEHDVSIGNNCHIAGSAVINGGVIIENNCFVGSGAIIKENLRIKRGSIIPANIFFKN
jgi:sugar O-acyltransferase (sialic acid O-acetyltransferase NeuD family)